MTTIMQASLDATIANRDTVQAVIADPHIGSNHALFTEGYWEGMNKNNHTATQEQIEIKSHFNKFADEIRHFREGKKLILILAGDLIEGTYHGTNETWTTLQNEMADMAIDLISAFQKRVGWQDGDELYCLRGTYVHSEDFEEWIGKSLGAFQGKDGKYSQDMAVIKTNGVTTWCVHHGPGAGTGANESGPEYNWLKSIHYNCQRDKIIPPDILYSAHVHKPAYSTFSWRSGWKIVKTMHGIISPAWKRKDRFAAKVSKVEFNVIGGFYQLITAGGIIDTPKFCIMDND